MRIIQIEGREEVVWKRRDWFLLLRRFHLYLQVLQHTFRQEFMLKKMFRWRILFRGRRRSPHPQRTVMDRNMLWMELPQKQFSGILQIWRTGELHQGTARILKNRLLSGFRSTGEKMQRKKIFRQLSFGIMWKYGRWNMRFIQRMSQHLQRGVRMLTWITGQVLSASADLRRTVRLPMVKGRILPIQVQILIQLLQPAVRHWHQIKNWKDMS